MKTHRPLENGFTLVELMVVVAMVGVLSAIAIPQYEHYTAKARQVEAKIALSAIYIAETTFFAENNSYSSCLRQLGYAPDGQTRYYLIGFAFDVASLNTCGPSGTRNCTRYDFSGTDNTAQCDGSDPLHPAYSDVAFAYTATIKNPGGYYNTPWNQHLSQPDPSGSSSTVSTSVTGSSFVAGAVGGIASHPASTALWCHPTNVNSGRCFDGWTIDQNKSLRNVNPGI